MALKGWPWTVLLMGKSQGDFHSSPWGRLILKVHIGWTHAHCPLWPHSLCMSLLPAWQTSLFGRAAEGSSGQKWAAVGSSHPLRQKDLHAQPPAHTVLLSTHWCSAQALSTGAVDGHCLRGPEPP